MKQETYIVAYIRQCTNRSYPSMKSVKASSARDAAVSALSDINRNGIVGEVSVVRAKAGRLDNWNDFYTLAQLGY